MNIVCQTLFNIVDIEEYEDTNQYHNMYDIMVDGDESFVLSNGVVSHNSALSPLISVRNPKTTGGFALKGKPLNIRGLSPKVIMDNKEISEMLSIIGLTIGQPATDLNYGKICCFSDIDTDGAAVFALLLNIFSMWPDLFGQKRIYRMLAPLYYCTKGKTVKIFYTDTEFSEFDSTGYTVSRFKGLGSMPEDIYSDVVNNPYLIQVIPDDMDKLEMAFGDDANKRKQWMTK